MIQVANFTYTIYAVPDNLYGVFDHETGEWNGIVKELMDRKADIAVAPMTINFARYTSLDALFICQYLQRECDRLYKTIHESWHLNFIQEE